MEANQTGNSGCWFNRKSNINSVGKQHKSWESLTDFKLDHINFRFHLWQVSTFAFICGIFRRNKWCWRCYWIDDDDEYLQGTTISGIEQLGTLYTCISCNRNVHPTNAYIGICDSCNTTQKLPSSKQSTKLLLLSGTRKVTVRAYEEALTHTARLLNIFSSRERVIFPRVCASSGARLFK